MTDKALNENNEAVAKLEDVLQTFLKSDYTHEKDLEPCLMRMLHVFQLLNWQEQIHAINKELQGYSSKDKIPDWRTLSVHISYKKEDDYHTSYVPKELVGY